MISTTTESKKSIESARHLLDATYQELGSGARSWKTVAELARGLQRVRRDCSPEHWRSFAREDCRAHPLMNLLQQDPYTRRAFEKPRGYPGDAYMIDFLYGLGSAQKALAGVNPIGRAVHEYTTSHCPASHAVRSRMVLLAKALDDVGHRNPNARIISVACGHVREALFSSAVRRGDFERFVALDHDPESLAIVERDLAAFGVEQRLGSVRQILSGETLVRERFDFVYAAGLYDYLDQTTARALTERLFGMLRPSGILLVANFLPDIRDSGYMEGFMDWWLVYRDEATISELAEAVPSGELEARTTNVDENGNVVYLKLRRGSST